MSCGTFMFNFIRNCSTVFQSNGTIVHSNQQCARGLVAPQFGQHLVLPVFSFLLAVLIGAQWYLILALISISPMANDVEYLVMCLFAIHIFHFGEMFIQIFDRSCCSVWGESRPQSYEEHLLHMALPLLLLSRK